MYIIFSDPPKYPVHRIEAEFPNTQFFQPITQDQLPSTAAIVYETTPPQVNFTQKAVLDPMPSLVEGKYYTSYTVYDLEGEELSQAIKAKQLEYDAILQQHFDQVAQTKGYTNWVTCSLRAGKPGPFQQEGDTFFAWMEQCNLQAYNILNQVLQGEIALPSQAEFITMLPQIVW